MVRVYLDWNVYSRIEMSNEPYFNGLKELLINVSYFFPYSTIHLIDIYESYKKVGWNNIQGHLNKLNLSNDLYLTTIFNDNLNFYHQSPIDMMKSYIVERNPKENFGEIELEKDENYIDYFPDTTAFLEECDKRNEEMDKMINKLNEALRNFIGEDFKEEYQKVMKINKGKLLNKNVAPLEYLNTNSAENGYENFEKYNSELLYKINKNPNLIEELATLFNTIDLSGYGEDKKGKFESTITDSLHCAYASTCDIFIVNDNKTYLKAIQVFKIKELNIKVFRPQHFIDHIKGNNKIFKDGLELINFIYDYNNLKSSSKTEKEIIYQFNFFILDFFNQMILNFEENSIYLQKFRGSNLSLLPIEKEDLLTKINSLFGLPFLIIDEWKENGHLNSVWLFNEMELIKLSINYSEVTLSFSKYRKLETKP